MRDYLLWVLIYVILFIMSAFSLISGVIDLNVDYLRVHIDPFKLFTGALGMGICVYSIIKFLKRNEK